MPDMNTRVDTLVAAIAATIKAQVEVNSDEGFSDAMCAIVTVAAGALMSAGGDLLDHAQGAGMIAQQTIEIIAGDDGRVAILFGKVN